MTGPAWFTPAERLPEWQREIHTRGVYNLGVAHGLPGVVPRARRGLRRRRGGRAGPAPARQLGELAPRPALPAGAGSCFGSTFVPWEDARPHAAGLVLRRPRHRRHPARHRPRRRRAGVGAPGDRHRPGRRGARGVDLATSATPASATAPPVSPTCSTGCSRRRERSGWPRRRGSGSSGPSTFRPRARRSPASAPGRSAPKASRTGGPTPASSKGPPGIGLALLGAVSEVEPAWDRVFLVSLPPVAEPNRKED